MGSSKTFRKSPGWAENITPRGKYSPSKGSKSSAEGTHQSGENDWGRKGMSNIARKKSKSGKTSVKAKVPSGRS